MHDSFEPVEPGLQRPLEYLRSVLIPTETLEAWAVQHRLFALSHRRVLVAATSGRLIMITRHLIGGFDVSDIRWQDLEEVTLRVGIFGADLSVRAGKAADLASQGLDRLAAPGLHGPASNPRRRRCIGSARRRIRPGARSAGSASSRSCARARAASR